MTTKKSQSPRVEVVTLDRIRPDPNNANLHTQKGQRIVTESMEKSGFGRPGLASKDGTVLAGNLAVTEVAPDLGATEVILIHTDGTRPVVHVRDDIDPDSPEAVALALADNRASEVSLNWDANVINRILKETPAAADGLWAPEEILEINTQQTDLPVIDGWNKENDFKRGQRMALVGDKIVVGFGRYSGLVTADLVGAIIRALTKRFGAIPAETLEDFCKFLLVDCLGEELPDLTPKTKGKGNGS